ncbi:DNA recombination protein RmuC [Lacisediminihabitans profunda]|uniref:DNA recombination protein RmuC n=1 Tax=Lacisediminihabitans profunda TaxID=2594790 RepID=A0A5C8UTD7_9MICO|nr:DNA recombination protein RmuC [Lacisediminihabitans profunda]TXN31170.1 DNA recombination protein RmuC [Lacisediminihabitans profunda]
MDPLLALIIGLFIGVLLGAVIGLLLARARRSGTPEATDPALIASQHEIALAAVRADGLAEQSRLSAELAAIQATALALKEQVAGQQAQYRELVERHRLEQLAEAERQQKESRVLQALSPVQESLRTMQLKVTELEAQRSQQHGELSQQLRTATESEERLRSTAESLASALRNNATRGVWGETQLRNVVQAAGLIERVDFDVQSSISSDAGAGRPDMVIHLPGGKNIAVDAKVPFNAYLEASQIAVTATGEEGARREQFIRQHVKAVRAHIDTLGSKAYWAGLDASPELVIAFIPSESLVSSALEADPGIMDYAFSKRVALSSPVTLWSVLKTVAFSWQQDVVTQEAKMLFDLSRELYGRLATLASHVDKLGRSIESTVKNYNGFVGSLERQVLPSARKLNVLDESKVLGSHDELEDFPRDLSAYELVAELEAVAALEVEPDRTA